MSGLREKKKLIARQKLIDAASVEFARVGYANALMATISNNAGYGNGTVYNYFPSKFDLLLAVVKDAMSRLVKEIRRETAEIDDPVARLKRGLEVDFKFMLENEALSKVIIREGMAAEPQKQVDYEQAIAPISELVVEMLEEGKRRGRFRSDLDSYWANIVLQGIVSYLLMATWTLGKPHLNREQHAGGSLGDTELAELTIDCFIDGVMAR
jgi:TetR/AcrR family fatty acid metabolism transcriptional regulator